MSPAAEVGTVATFAGIPCFDVQFARSRGWAADVTTVDVPAGPALALEQPGSLKVRRPHASMTRGGGAGAGLLGPAPVPAHIPHEGYLHLAERVGGEVWSVDIGPLFVVRCEAVKSPDGSQVVRYRLSLVDERYFWPRGILPRWSFNRRRGDGTIAADSLRPDGKPHSRIEVAALAAASLFRRPRIAHAPVEWESDRRAVEFEPFSPAVVALSQLATEDGLEEPCLRLDNTIAFHHAGDGRIGYAQDGRGPNAIDFPATVKLYKDGTGQGAVAENGFPEEFGIVVGGVRVASVAIDEWEPVLVLPRALTGLGYEVVRPINEATIRRLTGNRYGLDWLHRFILQPNAYQAVVGVDPAITHLLAEQAYTLFRLPGAVVEVDPTADLTDPGPNAHLLPLLPRAETIAGRRLPVRVEAPGFRTVHHAMRGGATEGQVRLAEILKGIEQLKRNAPARPLRGSITLGPPRRPLSIGDVFKKDGLLAYSRGVSQGSMQEMLDRVRYIESYRGAPGGDAFADGLSRLTREQLDAEVAIGGDPGRVTMFDIAHKVIEFERRLEQARWVHHVRPDAYQQMLDENPDLRQMIVREIEPLLRKIEADRRAERDRTRVGGAPADKPAGMVVIENVDRAEGAGGRVYDASLGIVQTSERAVHVELDPEAFGKLDSIPERPTNFSHARAVPCPVRVTFGAVVRPRTDRPPSNRPRTGDHLAASPPDPEAHCQPEGDRIPTALTDKESIYTAAFRRTGRGQGVRVQVDELFGNGPGAANDQAVRLFDPDMVELVPLEGAGNRAALDEQAERMALTRFLAPEQVTTTRTTLARPWPVQCDGLVSNVEIRMRFKDGAPCGFETTVTAGGQAPFARIRPRPRTGTGDGARREGMGT
ncbi:MAG: hypothetical protein M9894_14835 [Planctomycetes bacterium]|nr:hypothetical protein [Planctomycetota bacterium]